MIGIHRIGVLFLALLAAPAAAMAQATVGGWDPAEVEKAKEAVEQFKTETPKMQTYFDAAFAYAVYPSVGKAAFIVGGAHGSGTVFKNQTPTGRTKLTQGSIGFQFGGESFSEIVFFKDEKAFERFADNKLEFAAKTSATLISEGASADLSWEGGVAVFTRTKGGLIVDASLGGQKFTYEPYGEDAGESVEESDPDEGQ